MDAINDCDALAFVFPSSDEELRQPSQGFERTSTQGVMRGRIGAIDGGLYVPLLCHHPRLAMYPVSFQDITKEWGSTSRLFWTITDAFCKLQLQLLVDSLT
jgi:hypothetical protein